MANDMVQQLGGAVQRMPAQRRIALLGGLLLIAAAVIGVGLWASEPAWVPLYTDVSLGEAAQMTDALDKAGIQNKLGADGSQVLVARSAYARARVILAKASLPSGSRPGYELLDQQNALGSSDFIQRVNFQRALEGELAQSIGATTGVDRADVHLTIPEPSALRRNDRPAKAAVRLRMRPGMLLAPGAVPGIIALVSNSVDRLSPENVVVTDESGRLLSAPTEDGSVMGGAARRMEMQQSVEGYLAGKAERLLETVAGLGTPRVQVGADLNFDQVERTIESFDPDGQVLAAEGRSETEAAADGSGAQTIVNNTYQNSRRLEKILSAGGGVNRLTISVLVDERSIRADTSSTAPLADR
ncbi:MAG: flagellar basal-body MS-ring/collar protein FliF, partial [Gemmatimonadales bacterium]